MYPRWSYILSECYIRFEAIDYDIKNKSRLAHLTNNCIIKEFNNSPAKAKKAENRLSLKKNREPSPNNEGFGEEGDEMDEDPENIWSNDEFKDYMNKTFG